VPENEDQETLEICERYYEDLLTYIGPFYSTDGLALSAVTTFDKPDITKNSVIILLCQQNRPSVKLMTMNKKSGKFNVVCGWEHGEKMITGRYGSPHRSVTVWKGFSRILVDERNRIHYFYARESADIANFEPLRKVVLTLV